MSGSKDEEENNISYKVAQFNLIQIHYLLCSKVQLEMTEDYLLDLSEKMKGEDDNINQITQNYYNTLETFCKQYKGLIDDYNKGREVMTTAEIFTEMTSAFHSAEREYYWEYLDYYHKLLYSEEEKKED